MIAIKGKLKNKAEVATALGRAPGQFRKKMLGSLLTERDMFVGNRKRDGAFTKKLMRKRGVSGRKWARNVARIFGGRVDGSKRLEGMSLVMGVGESGRTKGRHKAGRGYGVGIYTGVPFLDVMDFLNYGGLVVPKANSFMIMPIYKNLPSIKKPRVQWQNMLKQDKLMFVRYGHRLYYFKKDGYGDDRDLMFVGIKRALVGRQYNFQGDWTKRLPRVFGRMQKRIDRATERINSGKA